MAELLLERDAHPNAAGKVSLNLPPRPGVQANQNEGQALPLVNGIPCLSLLCPCFAWPLARPLSF